MSSWEDLGDAHKLLSWDFSQGQFINIIKTCEDLTYSVTYLQLCLMLIMEEWILIYFDNYV